MVDEQMIFKELVFYGDLLTVNSIWNVSFNLLTSAKPLLACSHRLPPTFINMIWVQLLFADIWSSLSDLFNAKTIWAQNSFTFRSGESHYPLLQPPIFRTEVYRRICMNRYLPRFLFQVCREISWHRVANRCISLMLTDNMLRLGFYFASASHSRRCQHFCSQPSSLSRSQTTLASLSIHCPQQNPHNRHDCQYRTKTPCYYNPRQWDGEQREVLYINGGYSHTAAIFIGLYLDIFTVLFL